MLQWERATFRTADVVISTNESFRRIAIARGGKAPEDVFVVRSAPRLDAFVPGPGDPRHRHGTADKVTAPSGRGTIASSGGVTRTTIGAMIGASTSI